MPDISYANPLDRRNRYEKIKDSLWAQRATFDAHWKELGDFYQPRRTRFTVTDRNKGDKRNQNIINSTGASRRARCRAGCMPG